MSNRGSRGRVFETGSDRSANKRFCSAVFVDIRENVVKKSSL